MAEPGRVERLSERVGVGRQGRRVGRVTLVRLAAFYAFALGAVVLFTAFTSTPPRLDGWAPGAPAPASAAPSPLHLLLDGTMAITAGFLLSVPLAFVYVRTRSRLKYDRSLVQTVIMLPVVITAILIVVQNSLALAFSLAGIVAAVRFRNNLKDSRDAVYVFAAVGIGFAAGVHALPIAALLSVAFSSLELLLWKVDLTADHERTFGLLCMAGRPRGAGQVPPGPAGGDGQDPPPAAEPGNGDGKGDLLRVYATAAPGARPAVEEVLEAETRRWKRLGRRPGGVDQVVLDYFVRWRRESPPETVLGRIYEEAGSRVIAAEVLPHRAD